MLKVTNSIEISKFKKINSYYNNLFSSLPIEINNQDSFSYSNIYLIEYPIFYREPYYFSLTGISTKTFRKGYKLNNTIKFLSIIDNKKMLMHMPIHLPYLCFY